jgi:hypothetical protein
MTNLLEKSLLTGFGVFILIMFLSFVNPFIIQLFDVNQYYNDEVRPYLKLIDEIDEGINFVLINENNFYLYTIYYPDNLNISLYEHNIKYEFLISSNIVNRNYNYKEIFYHFNYILLPPKEYILNISYQQNFIKVLIY